MASVGHSVCPISTEYLNCLTVSQNQIAVLFVRRIPVSTRSFVHTAFLYETSNSNKNNCPVLTARGKIQGMKKGQHLKINAGVPISNLF